MSAFGYSVFAAIDSGVFPHAILPIEYPAPNAPLIRVPTFSIFIGILRRHYLVSFDYRLAIGISNTRALVD